MREVETQPDLVAAESRSRWRLAFAFTALVTVAGFIAAFQQFTAKFLWDESLHTRTIGGVLCMTLGLIGLYLPFRLFRNRKHFSGLSPVRQWFSGLGTPLLYVLLFAACFEASLRSKAPILPRPFTPTVVVTYAGSLPRIHKHRTGIEFRNALRENHLTGGFGHKTRGSEGVERFQADYDERFQADYDEGFLRHDDRLQMARFDGETLVLEDGRVQIAIDVDAEGRHTFDIRGLENAVISRDGETISPSSAMSGKYEIVIIGHPTKDT